MRNPNWYHYQRLKLHFQVSLSSLSNTQTQNESRSEAQVERAFIVQQGYEKVGSGGGWQAGWANLQQRGHPHFTKWAIPLTVFFTLPASCSSSQPVNCTPSPYHIRATSIKADHSQANLIIGTDYATGGSTPMETRRARWSPQVKVT